METSHTDTRSHFALHISTHPRILGAIYIMAPVNGQESLQFLFLLGSRKSFSPSFTYQGYFAL